ncbi:MAG: hypothetical protein C0465_20175 [Ralstonia sp.]|nr:hypothetical protein [Ralstonia sp.]MBA9846644.1 hypothetical protein [Ralstonia pickettii]PLT19064.1 hypothetical protein CXP34_03570 [Ralstonia mannitolilytica]MBA4232917.1 hypothetical protein [Ralstonia sp.]MBA4237053.1 hypothetical protein [Ralstonia sp.]
MHAADGGQPKWRNAAGSKRQGNVSPLRFSHGKSEVLRACESRRIVEQDIVGLAIQGVEIRRAKRRVRSVAEAGSEELMHLAEFDFGSLLDKEGVRDAAPAGELVHGCLSEHSER